MQDPKLQKCDDGKFSQSSYLRQVEGKWVMTSYHSLVGENWDWDGLSVSGGVGAGGSKHSPGWDPGIQTRLGPVGFPITSERWPRGDLPHPATPRPDWSLARPAQISWQQLPGHLLLWVPLPGKVNMIVWIRPT